MSKKYVLLLILCISCFLLTGCGDVIDITDDETKLIAEYAAEVLLKYDVNFNDRLNEGEKIQAELEEEAEESDNNPQLDQNTDSTEDGADDDQNQNDTSSSDQNNSSNNNSDNNDSNNESSNNESSNNEDKHNRHNKITDTDDDNTDVSDSVDSTAQNESDIAKILGLDGVSITYKDYIITDQYPATDADGQFIYLEASEGYQLLVVRFNISNTAGEAMNLTMLDEDIDYRIVCNGKRAANPMLTILMNDLATIETTLSSEEVQEAVLVFQISDDMVNKLQTMELKVEHNDTENIITIL